MLGEADRPWLGVTVRETDVDAAFDEIASYLAAGIDLIRIEVPIGRELAERMTDAGLEVPAWRPRIGRRGAARQRDEPAPTGSQRAIARVRRSVDRAAAERGAYVRLATVAPALSAPEGAVVAAFERIDVITSDAMAEIVSDGVEPDRSLADHAFAHRLARRAGTTILVGPGPLVVAPDLSAGVPSDPATRAGRALALQLLGVTLALGDGLGADQVVIGALPPWVTDEPTPGARAIAEVAVRRALFPDHPLGFVEPSTGTEPSVLWPYVQAAAAVHAGDIALVMRSPEFTPSDVIAAARSARAASVVSAEAAGATVQGELTGVALEHATGMLAAAHRTLEGLAENGWRTVAGDPPGGTRARAAVREVVTERTESFDPFASSLGPRA
jgi:hypothetical protein